MQDFTTPMMRQYIDIKKQYEDCLLFFRMGDFYELFLDDAHIGARVLDIVLTSRAKGSDGRVPMAGVPYHAVDSYISKLVKAGHKVAICEQITEPNKYGIVEREVIRIVTPGTVLDEQTLEKKENNFIMSLIIKKDLCGLAVADITTGTFQILEWSIKQSPLSLINEIVRISPSECILIPELYNQKNILKELKVVKDLNIYCFQEGNHYVDKTNETLSAQFGKQIQLETNLKHMQVALEAAAVLTGYLKYTQKDNVLHFKTITLLSSEDHMVLDHSTILNLELFSTLRTNERQGTLIHFLDHTATSMGGRMLRNWLQRPLINIEEIQKRHDAVEECIQNLSLRKKIQVSLKNISDVERTLSRVSLGVGNARDLVLIKESLIHILEIKKVIQTGNSELISQIFNNISSDLQEIVHQIDTNIVDSPSFTLKEGGLIKAGINEELDDLRKEVFGNKEWLEILEKQERERTGISSLKVRFNKVFGFYIEISKANLNHVPDNYIRKQTLVNAERFITDELKQKEVYILSGESKIFEIEYSLYKQLLEVLFTYIDKIQKAAEEIAKLDCLISFAILAELHHFSRAAIINTGEICIEQGRHPVVERSIGDEQFVPNNTQLDQNKNQLHIITGPNMAGKSVYIRQVAVIVLLNQIGSFVPAKKAELSIVDRIFVRSGASDMISEGLSTFMVEMVETAQILNSATSKSLVIMDEIGRGTSTFDGISIAWAVAQHLVENKIIQPKTLFATHYHELQELEKKHPDKIRNYHMAIEDENGKPVFLYTLLPGGASHSYGIAVAQLAGIPESVLTTANDILHMLEDRNQSKSSMLSNKKNSNIINQHPIIQELQKININSITPLQAMEKLVVLQKKIQ